jgi:hypothetical protein
MAGPILYKKGLLGVEFPSPDLWLDASDSSTLFDATAGGSAVSVNGSVARWEDKSGNGYHFTQSTSGNRPILRGSQLNSLNTIEFIEDWMFGNSASLILGNNLASCESFVVHKFSTQPTRTQVSFFISTSTIATTSLYVQFGNSSGKHVTASRRVHANAAASATSSASTGTGYKMQNSIVDFNAGTITQLINGSGDGTASMASTGNTLNVNSLATQIANIGDGSSTGGFPTMIGFIAEILFYRQKLTDTQRTIVTNYLNAKWAIY